ncbi:NUDIX domain-containing protein [Kitasatospora sp. NPDC094016]|uniref:NUDIX domain-containing protein n=1 Tax=Kitasatospora sp. NPDC094016 TaxID=3154986 RepID=UPI003330DBDD
MIDFDMLTALAFREGAERIGVGVVVRDTRGRILMIRRSAHGVLPGLWEYPGGDDFRPRNRLVRRERGALVVGVIDFERAQVEEPVRRDLMRVMLQLTPHHPDPRAAFLARHGRAPSSAKWAACRAWAAIDCPAALRRAPDHRGDEVLGCARTVLEPPRGPAPGTVESPSPL